MDHPESKGKIHLFIDAELVLFRTMNPDAVGRPVPFRPLARNVEHLLLQVNGYHPAGVSHDLCHAS
jgi:hypothetical protein